jgi:hypothetical protein
MVRLSAMICLPMSRRSAGSTSPSTAIMFGPQSRSKMTSGHCGIRAQHSSMPLSVHFRTDSAMTPEEEIRIQLPASLSKVKRQRFELKYIEAVLQSLWRDSKDANQRSTSLELSLAKLINVITVSTCLSCLRLWPLAIPKGSESPVPFCVGKAL